MAAGRYDLAVIGAGPGGYVAAIRAAQLGLATVVVEREHLGGICLNWGCIPTKALLRTSEIFHLMHRAGEFGLRAENLGFDLDAVVKRSRGVAKQLNAGVGHLLKKHKVAVIMGEATLTAPGRITVDTGKRRRGDRREGGDPRHRRPGARAARHRGRRQAGLDLPARARAAAHAQAAAGDRLGRDRDRVRELLQHPRRRDHGGRGAGPHPAGRGRGDLRPRPEGVREAEDANSRGGDGDGPRPVGRSGQGDDRAGRKDHDRELRHGDLGRRHRRQRREPRPRGARRAARPQPRRRRRVLPHRRRRALRHRRRCRAALARAQGDARGRRRRRADRGTAPASGARRRHRRLHLLPAADRQRRDERGEGEGGRATRSASAASRSSATARRSRSATRRGWSRRCSTRRPASSSART